VHYGKNSPLCLPDNRDRLGMHPMKAPGRVQSAGGIVVFHPGGSLMRQFGVWSGSHPGCNLDYSSATSLLDIHRACYHAAFVLIDAVEDPQFARLVLLQVMTDREAPAVAVYTEAADESLELFVRTRGGLLVLGPMSDASWEGVFEGMLQFNTMESRRRPLRQRRAGKEAERVTAGVPELSSGEQCTAGSCRPK